MINKDAVRKLLKEGEGTVSHMYLDTRANVTVGVGQLLETVDAAKQLSFVNRETGAAASEAEIEADFDAVVSQEAGRVAAAYKQYTHLDMSPDEIDALLDRRIDEFEAGLRKRFSGYDEYPEPAEEALLDMAFNLGLSGLVNKFPKLKSAAEARDWSTCAEECRRRGISDTRNQVTKELFEKAAQA